MDLKTILEEKVYGLKSIQPNSKRFDDIRNELLQYNFNSLHETIWNILNDFPIYMCKECNSKTEFKSYQDGYKLFCNISCSNKFKGKNEEINKKISAGVTNFNYNATNEFWDNRTKKYRDSLNNRTSEEKNKAKEIKSSAMKLVHLNRSTEEKNILNNKISKALKNSDKAKAQRKERAKLGAKALKEYKKTLTIEQLNEFNKRYNKGGIPEENKSEFKQYYKLVWYFTNINLNLVENIEKRSIYYHLDHKYSIKKGFLENISPEIIGSSINLEIISFSDNCSKGAKCSISKEDLLSSFEKLKIGDF